MVRVVIAGKNIHEGECQTIRFTYLNLINKIIFGVIFYNIKQHCFFGNKYGHHFLFLLSGQLKHFRILRKKLSLAQSKMEASIMDMKGD